MFLEGRGGEEGDKNQGDISRIDVHGWVGGQVTSHFISVVRHGIERGEGKANPHARVGLVKGIRIETRDKIDRRRSRLNDSFSFSFSLFSLSRFLAPLFQR